MVFSKQSYHQRGKNYVISTNINWVGNPDVSAKTRRKFY
jgi:hypothetical protein